jgi:hypothetical protein
MAIPNMDNAADHHTNDTSHPPVEPSQSGTKPAIDGDSKDVTTHMTALDTAAAIPKGTIDPVYEAKARVLNTAV